MSPLGRLRSANSSRARKVAVALAGVLLVAAVVPFVVFAVPQVVGADHGYVILSGSMEPALSPGDVVIVAATAEVAAGDIVTFDDGNEVPTTHRVVGTQDGQFVTKGDANEEPDSRLVARESLVGKVVLTIPLVGHVILWANTPTGYVAMVVAPLALLLVTELYSWARRGDAADTAPDGADDTENEDDAPAASTDADQADDAEAAAAEADAETDTEAEADADTDAEADPETDAETPSRAGTVAVAVADLKLTLLASGTLLAYAGWNVYGEVTVAAAPDPVSVGAATAGGLGLLFAGWVTVGAWHRARTADDSGSASATEPLAAETDGGTDTGGEPDADGADAEADR
jgi:signal peptidase